MWSVLVHLRYLSGTRFKTQTRHDLLKKMFIFAGLTGRSAHWQLRLYKFDFDAVYRAGIKHQVATALSHLTTTWLVQAPIVNNLFVAVFELQTETSLNTFLITDATITSDEADIQVIVQVVENTGAEKGRAVPSLQTICNIRPLMPSANTLQKIWAMQMTSTPSI